MMPRSQVGKTPATQVAYAHIRKKIFGLGESLVGDLGICLYILESLEMNWSRLRSRTYGASISVCLTRGPLP